MKNVLKRNTRLDMNQPFKNYVMVAEFSEKQTAAILERELSILHELKLLQNYLKFNYANIQPEDIYNTLREGGNQKQINFEWFLKIFIIYNMF